MELVPIKYTLEENSEFADNPDCKYNLLMTIEFYNKIGYQPPWIGYYANKDGSIVGSVAFKGKPINGKVEIAYVTFKAFQNQGIATEMCKKLIKISQDTDPAILVSARTLPDKNYSTKILQKNGFTNMRTILDTDGVEVWEWELQKYD
jgi:RimJ/RimL family protein N-acetyltransferase